MSSRTTSSAPVGRPASMRWQPPDWWQPAVQYVVGNWIALACGLLVAFIAMLHAGRVMQSTIKTGDFMAYYGGSRLIATGHGAQLYDAHALRTLETAVLQPLALPHGLLMPYIFPPYFAIALTPIAALPYDLAFAVWLLLNCLLLVMAMFALERYTGLTGRPAAILRFALIGSLPTLLCLFNGQTSLLTLALVTLSFFAARSGRDGLTGVFLALAAIKPAYIPILLVVFLVRGRWRTLIAFGITYLCLLALPMLLLGPSIDVSYARSLLAAEHWGHGLYGWRDQTNVSLTGFLQLLLPQPLSSVVRLVLSALLLVALVWTARRAPRIELPFALAVVVALLISTHVMEHDLALSFVAVAVALHYRGAGPKHLVALLAAGYVIVLIGYLLVYKIPVQTPALVMLALGTWLFLAARRQASERPVRPVPASAASLSGRSAASGGYQGH